MSQRLEIWTIAQKWMTIYKNVKREEKQRKGEEKEEENEKDENNNNNKERNGRNIFQSVIQLLMVGD